MKKRYYLHFMTIMMVALVSFGVASCSSDDDEDNSTELLISLKDVSGRSVNGHVFFFPDGDYDESSFTYSSFGSIKTKNGENVTGDAVGSAVENKYLTFKCSAGRYYIVAMHFPKSYSGIPRASRGSTYATAIKNKSTVVEIIVK